MTSDLSALFHWILCWERFHHLFFVSVSPADETRTLRSVWFVYKTLSDQTHLVLRGHSAAAASSCEDNCRPTRFTSVKSHKINGSQLVFVFLPAAAQTEFVPALHLQECIHPSHDTLLQPPVLNQSHQRKAKLNRKYWNQKVSHEQVADVCRSLWTLREIYSSSRFILEVLFTRCQTWSRSPGGSAPPGSCSTESLWRWWPGHMIPSAGRKHQNHLETDEEQTAQERSFNPEGFILWRAGPGSVTGIIYLNQAGGRVTQNQ